MASMIEWQDKQPGLGCPLHEGSHCQACCSGCGPRPSKTLNFNSCYDESIPEDQRFQKATPSASAKFVIDNPGALEPRTPAWRSRFRTGTVVR